MEPERSTRVLVVANRTAATRRLLDEVARRADAGPCEFSLLIPDAHDRTVTDWTLSVALRLMDKAAKGEVEGLIGGPDPYESVCVALDDGDFDEIIISTLPRRVSRWLRRDLVRRVEGLGLPVTAIIPGETAPVREHAGVA